MGLLSLIKNRINSQKENSKFQEKDIFYSIPYLGELNLNKTKDLDTIIKIDETEFSISLNFDNDTITKFQVENVKQLLEKVDKYIKQAKQKIKDDINSNGVTKDYYDHHYETNNGLERIYQNENGFLDKLILFGIRFYPEDESHYAIFDFTIGPDITDYLIVVRFEKNLNFDSIDFVS